MDANDYKQHTDKIVGGLDGLISTLNKTMLNATKGLTQEEAKKFKKAFEENKIPEKIVQMKREMLELQNDSKIKD